MLNLISWQRLPSRPRTPAVLALLAAIAAGSPAQASEGATESRNRQKKARKSAPNVIIVLADDLGYYDVGFTGSPVIQTPHIDRFAAEGVTFRAAYAGAPICSPARAALMTGRFPGRLGIHDVVRPGLEPGLQEQELTIANMLRESGYATFFHGKWHLSNKAPTPPRQTPGFDPGRAALLPPAWSVVSEAIRWLDRGRRDPEAPFFMYLALVEPHQPVENYASYTERKAYESPESEAAAREVPYLGCRRRTEWANRTAYFAAVSQIDDAFGRLLAYLDANSLRQNTLIIFTSDNGPEGRTPWAFGSAGPFSGCKEMLYEGGIRVPTAMQWRRKMAPGLQIDQPIHAVDFLPTIAKASGAKLPQRTELDGINLLPMLRGRLVRRPKPLFWMYWAGRSRNAPLAVEGGMQAALRSGRWKILGRLEPLRSGQAVSDYIHTAKFDHYELYDLRADPGEARDLSESHPKQLERLAAELIAARRESLIDSPRFSFEHLRPKVLRVAE